MAKPEAAELYGLSAASPEANPTVTRGNAARADASSDGGAVIRRQWSAGQRKTVREYFKQE
ncbi:MAG: hypothetical protein HYY16_00740 [Planctomycetes bacterium]|nr:hypothetical protein [Planctomycetota bacterium]